MANSYSQYALSGTTYSVTFNYLKEAHITVYVDAYLQSSGWSVVGSNVVFDTEPTGTTVTLRRTTPRTLATQLVDFADGAVLTESDLDAAQRQLLYIAQEAFERDKNDDILPESSYLSYGETDGKWDAAVSGSAKAIKNVLADTDGSSAVTRGYVDSLALYGVVGNPKTFTGTLAEGEATYTLTGLGSQTYINAAMLVVSMGGVLQVPGTDYSIAGTDDGGDAQIVFSPTPGSGDVGTTFSVVNFGSARLGGVSDGSVTTDGLADDSVTAAKLADSAFSSPSRAVTANHIQDSAVTTSRIADDAVTAAKLATDSVTGDAVAADSIAFSELKATDFYSGVYSGTAPYVLRVDSEGDLTAGPLDGTEIPNLSNAVASLPISDMGTATNHVQMGDGTDNYQIKNLLTPSADSDAATKSYVDGLVGGMKTWSSGAITITDLYCPYDSTTLAATVTGLPSDIGILTGVHGQVTGVTATSYFGSVSSSDNGTLVLNVLGGESTLARYTHGATTAFLVYSAPSFTPAQLNVLGMAGGSFTVSIINTIGTGYTEHVTVSASVEITITYIQA